MKFFKKNLHPLIQTDGLWENFVSAPEYIDSGENKKTTEHERQNDVVNSWCPP